MLRLAKYIVLIITFSFAWFSADAQTTIHLYDTSGIHGIGKNLALYEDKTAALTIDQISSAYAGKFEESGKDIPNYNLTKSHVWCRLQLVNHTQTNDWYLESSNGSLSNIELYCPVNKKFVKVHSGFATSPSVRDLYSNRVNLHLDLPKDSVKTFYICLYDKLPLQVNLSVGAIKDLLGRNHTLDFLNGAFFGLLFMLVVYNLFIYFSVRDRIFIYYVLYVISNALFISYANGYGSHLPQWFTSSVEVHPTWVPFLLGASSCIFMMNFLNLKQTLPWAYRACVCMVVLISLVLITDLIGFTLPAVMMVQLLGMLLSVFSMAVGYRVWKGGYLPAKFFLIGFSFYLIGLFMYIAGDLQLISFSSFTHNALQIGTAFEAILLSMAVGDKISNFKKDKEQAQEEALAAARENERLVRGQNVMLEQKVKERTIELQHQKELVEEKNKDILDSIRYAKRIQQSLLPSEAYIKRVLAKLKK